MQSNDYDEGYFKRQYAFVGSKSLQLPIDFSIVIKFLSPRINENVMDLGCGLGRLAFEISKAECNVLGVDTSKFAIDFAAKYFTKNNLKFICSDALSINYENFFDYALCYHMLEHLTKLCAEKVLLKVNKALKTNGVIVVGVPIEESSLVRRAVRQLVTGSPVRDPTHLRSLSIRGILGEIAESGFKVTDVFTFAYHPKIRSLDKKIPLVGEKITTNAVIRGIKLGR